jgi:hypothetical protein
MQVVELILFGAHHGMVILTRKMCFMSAICVQTVIFIRSFMYFMKICKSDYFIWNPYLASEQGCISTVFSQLLNIGGSAVP